MSTANAKIVPVSWGRFTCVSHIDLIPFIQQKYKQLEVVSDKTCIIALANKFQAVDWRDYYPVANESVPPNVLET